MSCGSWCAEAAAQANLQAALEQLLRANSQKAPDHVHLLLQNIDKHSQVTMLLISSQQCALIGSSGVFHAHKTGYFATGSTSPMVY